VYIYRTNFMVDNANPLQKYYRQPAVYITLPSKGKYYTPDVFTPTETGELPVLPMTAKDEMTFKTPDSLMNGQATVDVIQSCVPNIKNAWKMVNHDLDTVLLAIRIATYGEMMDINAVVPGINEQVTQSVNLPALLESIKDIEVTDTFKTKAGFEIKTNPFTYKQLTDAQIKSFEQQKIYLTVNNSQLDDAEKNRRFAESLQKLNTLNFDLLVNAVQSITTPNGETVTDMAFIKEFIDNADSKTIEDIQKGLSDLRVQANVKPLQVKSTEEQIKKGAPVSYEVPVTFDSANFFG